MLFPFELLRKILTLGPGSCVYSCVYDNHVDTGGRAIDDKHVELEREPPEELERRRHGS